jgi:hypothetical protein
MYMNYANPIHSAKPTHSNLKNWVGRIMKNPYKNLGFDYNPLVQIWLINNGFTSVKEVPDLTQKTHRLNSVLVF